MPSEALNALWFLVPAGVANMAPVFAAKLWPGWDLPVNKIMFGAHKTWRGLVSGVVAAFLTGWVMGMGGIVGAFLGLGALVGDLGKSLVKRRMGMAPGKSWFPWDQVDWVAGMIIVSWPMVRWTIVEIVWLSGLGLGLHLVVKMIGYVVKVNERYI